MVEASEDQKSDEYTPSSEEQLLIVKHLGDANIVDKKFKSTVVLSKEQAAKRKELVLEIEYDFQIALQKGDYYLGNAVINFYLKKLPNSAYHFLYESGSRFASSSIILITLRASTFLSLEIKLESW